MQRKRSSPIFRKGPLLTVKLLSGHYRNLFKVVATNLKEVGRTAFKIPFAVKGDREAENAIVTFRFV